MTEGVDYSRTPSANWTGLATALRANGKTVVGRYAVTDKSPNGRGISAAEFQAMRDAGIETFLYWEQSEGWMLGGFDAGVRAAQNAQANIVAAGMPGSMPVYFAHDIDPQRQHFPAVDACLRGAASVIGWERVGVYGGWLLIDYLAGGGTVKWLCQTVAWEYGHGVHPAATIYQYDTQGNFIAGVDCDLIRTLQPIYGQASAFLSGPPIEPTHPPVEHIPSVPWDETEVGLKDLHGVPALAFYGESTASRDVPIRESADSKARIIATVTKGSDAITRGSTRTTKNRWIFIEIPGKGVGRALWSAWDQRWPLP